MKKIALLIWLSLSTSAWGDDFEDLVNIIDQSSADLKDRGPLKSWTLFVRNTLNELSRPYEPLKLLPFLRCAFTFHFREQDFDRLRAHRIIDRILLDWHSRFDSETLRDFSFTPPPPDETCSVEIAVSSSDNADRISNRGTHSSSGTTAVFDLHLTTSESPEEIKTIEWFIEASNNLLTPPARVPFGSSDQPVARLWATFVSEDGMYGFITLSEEGEKRIKTGDLLNSRVVVVVTTKDERRCESSEAFFWRR